LYRIAAIINDVAYLLELPPHTCLHNVFHVGLLKKFVGTPATPPTLPPVHHGATQPVLEHASRTKLAYGVRQVLIHWQGEPSAFATWEDIDSFTKRYPSFQLEDELLVKVGRDVMWGRHYSHWLRTRGAATAAPKDAHGLEETKEA
jgi:hypothetical protein